MANDPAFDYYGNAPGIWGRLRARWANMSSAYRYNAVLYGLAAVALTALVLEVALGESSPKFEVATQVVPLTTTTRPRPTTTFGPTTTVDPLAITTTVPGEVVAAAGSGPRIGPLTPTTRRGAAGGPNPTRAPGGGSKTTSPTNPQGGSDEPLTDTTFPPLPPPSNPGTTNPPATTNTTSPPPTSPPPSMTVPSHWCDKVPPGSFGCP